MIGKLPLLYSRTSHGQVQTWQIEIYDNTYRTHEGILDGVITTSSWTACASKNKGKKNETSPEEQAEKEARAKHKNKLEANYHLKIEDIDTPRFFEPMTAKKWSDEGDKVVFPVYSQPKLDGLRCVVSKNGMFSREGKPIVSAPHVFEAYRPFFIKNPDLVFDGELYAHKLKNDFDAIMSLARQTKPTPEGLALSAKNLSHWVYDMFDPANAGDTFLKRTNNLKRIGICSPCIVHVPTLRCETLSELDAAYADYLSDGMEGQMIRTDDTPYQNKRSKSLLKRKTFTDKEFEIADILSGRGGHADIAAKVVLLLEDKRTFEAGIIGSHDFCRDLLLNKEQYIGLPGTVIFQNLTPDGIPRFGKFKAVRTLL